MLALLLLVHAARPELTAALQDRESSCAFPRRGESSAVVSERMSPALGSLEVCRELLQMRRAKTRLGVRPEQKRYPLTGGDKYCLGSVHLEVWLACFKRSRSRRICQEL